MEIRFTRSFERDYRELPKALQSAVDKKLLLFLGNSKHPSLRVKKMEGYANIWEGRVSKGCRFTFCIIDATYVIRRVGTHDVLRKP